MAKCRFMEIIMCVIAFTKGALPTWQPELNYSPQVHLFLERIIRRGGWVLRPVTRTHGTH